MYFSILRVNRHYNTKLECSRVQSLSAALSAKHRHNRLNFLQRWSKSPDPFAYEQVILCPTGAKPIVEQLFFDNEMCAAAAVERRRRTGVAECDLPPHALIANECAFTSLFTNTHVHI